jgi:hypothetical protein
MDINRLMAEAVARHGVKLDANDPAMVVVTLNRLMLEEAVRGVADEIRKAVTEFDAAGERMQKGVGVAVAREVARAGSGVNCQSRLQRWQWAGLMFLLGVLAGRLV